MRILMWPFKCKKCPDLEKRLNDTKHDWCVACDKWKKLNKQLGILWKPLSELPPTNTNILVANKDFTYFGFLYYEDGWDYSRKINMQGKGQVWATYTNAESIAWW